MNHASVRTGLAAAAWLLATCTAVAAEPSDTLRQGFGGRATIAADGSATVEAITGLRGPLEQAVRTQVAALRFQPAVRNGVPVTTTVPLSGSAALTPAGSDAYAVRVDVSAQPHFLDGAPPVYPLGRMAGGDPGVVQLRLQVGADGHVRAADVVSSNDRDFANAARTALRKWRFEPLPEGIDTMEVRVPVWFHVDWKPSETPAFDCASDPSVARVEGQQGCADLLEVVATRVMRGTKVIPGGPGR